MNHEQSQRRTSHWWIWPLLPFTAVIGAGIGASLLTLFQWFGMKMQGGYREDGWYFLYILPVMSSAMFGWLYAYITLYLAPRGKVIAASVMVTILSVISAIGMLFMWFNPHRELGELIQASLGTITMMVAAIATVAMQKDAFE